MKAERWRFNIIITDKPEGEESYLTPKELKEQLEKCFGHLEAGVKARIEDYEHA